MRVWLAVLLFAVVALSACTSDPDDSRPVLSGTAPAHPFGGSLTGNATRALQCRYDVFAQETPTYRDGLLEAKQDIAAAVTELLSPSGSGGRPVGSGYRIERKDAHRALVSYAVAGRNKIAILLRDGVRDYLKQTGWGVTSWAMCDPVEFPANVTEELGYRAWQDKAGNEVPISTVAGYPGDDFCDQRGVEYLSLGRRYYVRDSRNVFAGDVVAVPFDGDATTPADARDSGYHLDGRELWLSPREESVYLVSDDRVERWPHFTAGCG